MRFCRWGGGGEKFVVMFFGFYFCIDWRVWCFERGFSFSKHLDTAWRLFFFCRGLSILVTGSLASYCSLGRGVGLALSVVLVVLLTITIIR